MLAALTYTVVVATLVLFAIWVWDTAWQRVEAREQRQRMDDLRERRAIRDAARPQPWKQKDAA